jgi:hypothetical protein
MRLLIGGVLLLALVRGCPGPDAAGAGSAGEAVARHLVAQNFGAHETSPWEVVCLRLRDGLQVEDEAAFLRRFHGDPASGSARMSPVVPDGASGGPIDFSLYECMLARREGRWEVEECQVFVMT